MALQMTRTVAGTGAVFPQAYGRIDNALITLSPSATGTALTLNWYADGTAASGGKATVDADGVTFTPLMITSANAAFVSALDAQLKAGLVASPSDALKAALYCVLKQLPAYSGALDV